MYSFYLIDLSLVNSILSLHILQLNLQNSPTLKSLLSKTPMNKKKSHPILLIASDSTRERSERKRTKRKRRKIIKPCEGLALK